MVKKKTRLILNIEKVEIDGNERFRVTMTNHEELIVDLCRTLTTADADHLLLDAIVNALTMVLGATIGTSGINEMFMSMREQALRVYDECAKLRENNAKPKETQCS